MSFASFCRNENFSLLQPSRNRCSSLRSNVGNARQYQSLAPPQVCGFAGQLLHKSYPSSVCMIRRPLCGTAEPVIQTHYDYLQHANSLHSHFGYDHGPRSHRFGWQKIGYLLPLYVEENRSQKRCTCKRIRRNAARNYNMRNMNRNRASQFGFNGNYSAPQDDYEEHAAHCPLSSRHEPECTNRNCGARRYHLYVRVDPDRLGQQCFYTSRRRGDHRYNNCRYLQFGVSEEGLHNSTIMILSPDFLVSGRQNGLVSRHSSRCLEDGDVVFVPSERNKKFTVHLYDDGIYDGSCGSC